MTNQLRLAVLRRSAIENVGVAHAEKDIDGID